MKSKFHDSAYNYFVLRFTYLTAKQGYLKGLCVTHADVEDRPVGDVVNSVQEDQECWDSNMHATGPNQKSGLPDPEPHPCAFCNVKKSDQCHPKSTNNAIYDVWKLNVVEDPTITTAADKIAKDSYN